MLIMQILTFGSLNFDFVYDVDHMVVRGETLSSRKLETFCGGKGLNQAIAVAKAGVPVFLAGKVGEDGDLLLETCRANKVDARYVRKEKGKTGHAIIQVDKAGDNCIILYNGCNYLMTKEFIDEVLSNFAAGDILLLQNEINLLDYIIAAAAKKKMFIILNPSPCNEKLLQCDLSKVSLFILNEIEGMQISGEQQIDKITDAMLAKYPHSRVVLTLGDKGSVYRDQQSKYQQDCIKAKVVDTTAAGDTFTGYFIAGLVAKLSVPDNLLRCSKAAAITVSRKGATNSIPLLAELEGK